MTFEPATAGNSAPTTFSLNVTPDVTTWLPERAKEKLLALRQHSSDLNRLIPPFDQLREAGNEKTAAEGVLRRLQAHQSAGGFNLPSDDVRVIDAERRLERLAAEHHRLRKLSDERSATWTQASQALGAVEAFLKDGKPSGAVLEDHEAAPPALSKGETLLDAVARHQRRVRELRADLNRIRSAPYPASYCKAQMRQQVETLAQRGAVNVSRLVEHDGDIAFPTMLLRSEVHAAERPAVAFAEVPDVVAMTCWLHKPALIAALDREIDGEADDKVALSHDEREKRESVVLGDLLAVERDLCSLIWRGLGEKLPVEFAADTSPLAILQCALIAAPRADLSPGSSPGHVHMRR